MTAIGVATSALFAMTGRDVFTDLAPQDSSAALAYDIVVALPLLMILAFVMIAALIDLGERDAARSINAHDVISLALIDIAYWIASSPLVLLRGDGVLDALPSSITFFGGAALLALLVFLIVRLSLVSAHTLAIERLDFVGAWRLTKRDFGPLLLVLIALLVLVGGTAVLSQLAAAALVRAVDPIEAPVESLAALLRPGPLIHLLASKAVPSAMGLYLSVATCNLYREYRRKPEPNVQPAS